MLAFYEMKAVDPYETHSAYEEEKEIERESMLQNIQKVDLLNKERKLRRQRIVDASNSNDNNLDDSREDDFEGLEDMQFNEPNAVNNI